MDPTSRPPAAASVTTTPPGRPEQLIGALTLVPLDRPPPELAPLPTLPSRSPAADIRLDATQVDASGRIHVRGLIDTLGWQPGQHIRLDVVNGVVVIHVDPGSRAAIGGRGTLVLPAAIRNMSHIDPGSTVIAAADPAVPALFVHPERTVARLLAGLHRHATGGDRAR